MSPRKIASTAFLATRTGGAAESDPQVGNLRETTVGELSGALKRTIEDRFGLVRVRGEVSNYRGPHSSGHAYFSLKDDTARIDAVIWRTAFARLKTKPQEGLDVIATGRVTTFPGKSSYQIVIDTLEPAGVGALMALLDQRRRALAAEGLFDVARKRALPFLPRRVGVVTSPTGAVIRDILHRIADRFPRDVMVWPVRVQGETAADEVAAAIAGFNALSLDVPPGEAAMPLRPDVLIVARGGGSLEDLWAFNEEIVVRAAAASTIPLISAIGHETDTTLLDHVADLRAPTPSGAAEKAVPVRSDLLADVDDVARRLGAAMVRLGERRRADLRALARVLPTGDSLVALPRQLLDRAEGRIAAAGASGLHRRYLDLSRFATRLSHHAPRTRLARNIQQLATFEQRLRVCRDRAGERRVRQLAQNEQRLASARLSLARDLARAAERRDRLVAALSQRRSQAAQSRHQHLSSLSKLLATLGYRQVLARGFALVRDGDGRPLRGIDDVQGAAALDIEFADGHIAATAARIARPRRSRAKVKSVPDVARGQDSLF